MSKKLAIIAQLLALQLTVLPALSSPGELWTQQEANSWYGKQPWLVGANYNPASAINQLEMWQAATFCPEEIDKELGWAESLGMNSMRVYLHDLLWKEDASGFKRRLDTFLSIAAKHKIRPVLVLFDSCWDPFPQLGPQHPPIPGVHNSGWVQSPGAVALKDTAQHQRLKEYVQGVVGAFGQDSRVLAWDVWNEPDNMNGSSYGKVEPKDKQQLVAELLPQVFAWAREVKPVQPLTSGVWAGDWSLPERLNAIQKIQLEQSDVISYHNYSWPEDMEEKIGWLRRFGRPLLCTEYMARGNGSTFDTILPLLKRERIAAYNWGLVAGKTQTYLPWDSWQRPYVIEEPTIWFHEVFRSDGRPYREREAQLIRSLTAAPAAVAK